MLAMVNGKAAAMLVAGVGMLAGACAGPYMAAAAGPLAGATKPAAPAAAEPLGPGQDWAVAVAPNNSFEGFIVRGNQPVLQFETLQWGPNWRWAAAPKSQARAVDGLLQASGDVTLKVTGERFDVNLTARQSSETSVTYRYELSAEKDVALSMIAPAFSLAGQYAGRVVLTLADGTERTIPLPLPSGPAFGPAARVKFEIRDMGDFVIALTPSCMVQAEQSALRVILAAGTLKQGRSAVTLEMSSPGGLGFLASQEDADDVARPLVGPDWFPYEPKNDFSPGVIGMNEWLDKPAGKHGTAAIVGDHFEFADGTPVKFWGTNLSYPANCCPVKKEDADQTAARFAKYGVNCVRLHKFCGCGIDDNIGISDPNDGTKLTAEGLERLDYFCSKLAENGVYFAFSHTFGYLVREGNRDRLLAYDEIVRTRLKRNTYSLINIAEDVQDLMIEMVVGLLEHRNPYTGKTYAEDPALAYVELQNEDDIFFFSTARVLNEYPTYRKVLMGQYADWLKARYGSQEGLATAWGSALRESEKLDEKNLALQGDPSSMAAEGLARVSGNPGALRRLLDNAAFFHDVQNKFYGKFVRAIREAGYKGPLCGSPWLAPPMLPHYYNLRSDYLVGWIDRHNYAGKTLFYTMLSQPGSGELWSGLQQVSDRPFGISEWIHVHPALYSAEAPAALAAYGMGLQGWDASFVFQSLAWCGGFAKNPINVFHADIPTQMGQFPVLSRMVLRGDVKEGETISVRRVGKQNLSDGKFSFRDDFEASDDVNAFGGSCPGAALAAGRCVVEFTEESAESTLPDMGSIAKDRRIVSNTGQLAWDYSGKGFFTVNTDGTKAVVGFAKGKELALGDVKIAVQCPYASLFLTAAERDATLANAGSALLSAVARNCNSGFKYLVFDNRVLENGTTPIMLEPVKAKITIAGRAIAAVNILDHDGNRTDRALEVRDGAFTIDGAQDKALYYEVVFR